MIGIAKTEVLRRDQSAQLASILLYGTFALLMFGPLAFGAVEPWSIFMLEAGAVVLALIWVAKQCLDGEIKIVWNPLFLPMAAFGLLTLVQIAFNVTAYRHDTLANARLFIAYAILCFLSTQTLLRGAQARKLAFIFCVYAAAIAVFALLQGISSNGKLYWLRTPRMGGWIYGPYVNHNHYAGLMELLIPVPLVLCLTKMVESKERIAAAAAAALMAGTVFLSGSRGGMVALLAELALLTFVLIKQRHDLRSAAGLGVFLLIVVGLLTWLGGDELTRRLATVDASQSDLTNSMRLQIDRDGLHMFAAKPILGWGLGSFPVIYPQFRSFYTNFFVNQAHDDYLQLLVETGLLGFGTMVWFVVVIYRRAFSKITQWPSQVSGALSLACVLGVTGMLVHSTVDFNLQIPANAALFFVISTLAAANPLVQPLRRRKPVEPKVEEEAYPAPEAV